MTCQTTPLKQLNSAVLDALIMLDRISCSYEDSLRIDAVADTVRLLHARVQELEAHTSAEEQSAWIAGIDEGSSRQRVPEGWQLVPIEPTAEMREVGREAYRGDEDERGIYQAMLETAPQPEKRENCWCESCDKAQNVLRTRMSLCPQCGNKRCPRAQQHDQDCQNSNT